MTVTVVATKHRGERRVPRRRGGSDRTVVTAPAKPAVAGFTVVPVDGQRCGAGPADRRPRPAAASSSRAIRAHGTGGATFHPLAAATVLAPTASGRGDRGGVVVGAARTGLPPNGRIAAVALAVTAATRAPTTAVTAYPRGQPAGTGHTMVSARRVASPRSGVGIVAVGAHGDVTVRNATATRRSAPRWRATGRPTRSAPASVRVTPTTLLYAGTLGAKPWRTVKVAAGEVACRQPAR